VNTDVFAPVDRSVARRTLGLSAKRRVLAFGANSIKNPVKGINLLIEALRRLPSDLNLTLLTFGSNEMGEIPGLHLPVVQLGSLSSEEEVSLVYNAADAVAVPSLQDNLPQVATEALTCGTPIVAFDVGGLPDIVDHGSTGYLAKAYDVEDLARGIEWALETEPTTARVVARAQALRRYSPHVVASMFLDLYDDVIQRSEGS
jgi:glycosyltransferase involved in cell wall biosynthesis